MEEYIRIDSDRPIGEVFGGWTVIKSIITIYNNKKKYTPLCRCKCGFEKIVQFGSLKSGKSTKCRICGYLESNRPKTINKIKRKNRYPYECPEYMIWAAMKHRCYNKNNPNYKNYGERGIRVCEKWKQSFDLFMDDMGFRPSDNHSIDRIDVNGNYEPENCRWATTLQQSNNRRNNIIVLFNDTSYTAADFSRLIKISPSICRYYLKKLTPKEIYDKFISSN